MPEVKEISKQELKEWYTTRTINDCLEHFEIRFPRDLYKLLDAAGVPRKQPGGQYRLVD